MGRLQDRVAVVTGSTAGMGEGIARLFAEEGGRLVISGRDEKKGQGVTDSILKSGGHATFRRADVTIEADCRALIEATVKHYGRIDVLVNNVGLSTRGTIEDTTVELWDRLFATNVRSAFICMQQAVRHMKTPGSRFDRQHRFGQRLHRRAQADGLFGLERRAHDAHQEHGELPQPVPDSSESTQRRLDRYPERASSENAGRR